MHIFHIAYETDWQKAVQTGEYRISTRGRTLEQQGFIHASGAEQVAPVANLIYGSDEAALVVLVIDVDRLQPEIRYEFVPGSDAPFPHIYGAINADAVVDTLPLTHGPHGRYLFARPPDSSP
jgi:uncharacterized protein (DUF952 family)